MPATKTRGALRDARIVSFLIAALVIALDRWSKLWVERNIHIGHARVIIPHVFRLTHVLNTGAAFSLFEGSTSPATVRNVLIAFSVFAVLVVLVLLLKFARQFTLVSLSLALILGGAIGNLYDRLRYSHVLDFLEVHIIHYHWPDFNVADSAICIGACLLLIEMLRPQHSAKR